MASSAWVTAANGRRDEIWKDVGQVPSALQRKEAWIRPASARVMELDIEAWTNAIKRIQPETSDLSWTDAEIITLPMPDGTFALFQIAESPVMAPELAARFPDIKTYSGVGLDDPHATLRMDWTPQGFHAQILSPRGAVYIDPYSKGDRSTYSVYYKRDHRRNDDFQCLVRDRDERPAPTASRGDVTALRSGPTLRAYRLACAATAEYTAFHGGTVTQGLAAIVTAVNRVTGVYEKEVGVRLVLVANNNLLVYTSAAGDPYTNNDGTTMLDENQANVDSVIGSGNYDIGHVFSTGGGGIAGLGVVCNNSRKAEGVTGQSSPIGDPFYIDYVAHEMGHQFDADHTFNSTTSSCNGNRNAPTAYEPGSGSTIMSYAGICGSDNLQNNSDPYFHSISFDQIIAYIESQSCDNPTSTGNTAPDVEAGPNYIIPAGTPFILTASGSDIDGDPLTYCWEERDLGVATTLTAPDNGSSPLFRSFNPTTNNWRTFPRLTNILNNTASLGEKLPTTSRTMSFRVTARDNQLDGGGVNTDDMVVTVSTNAGPFTVTAPNSAVIWSGQQTVAWSVAKTTGTPVNAQNVDIHLSIDGGFTWPFELAIGTRNDGTESVILPNITTTNARIKVQGSTNIFFDVSNVSFSIVPGTPVARIEVDSIAFTNETCVDANGRLDPDEFVTARVSFRNTGTLNASNVAVTLLSTTNLTVFDGGKSYGTLLAGGGAVTQSYNLVSSGNCGDHVMLLFSIAIGTNQPLTITNAIPLGAPAPSNPFNSAAMLVPGSGDIGAADLYPSTIDASGYSGSITSLTVTISGIYHTWPDDLDILLVGPSGQSVVLMSDAGSGTDLSNVQLTFDDAASVSLANSSAITSGTYKPSNYSPSDTFPAPAPAGPYGSTLSGFIGTNPNGIWSLYIYDDQSGDVGSVNSGWSLSIGAESVNCCTQLVVLPPSAVFTTTPTNGTVPLVIVLEDQSTGIITNRFWNFGDGQTTNTVATNLVHTYQTTGVYTVNLTISGPTGIDTQELAGIVVYPDGLPHSDISVWQTDVPDIVFSNDLVRYDVTVSNAGPDNASIIMVTNLASSLLTFQPAFSSPECLETNSHIQCEIHVLNAGGITSLVLTFTVDPLATGSITNEIWAQPDTIDTNQADNMSVEVTLVRDLDGDGSADFVDEDDDGDNVSDEDELIADSDATDSNSFHRILSIAQPLQTEISFPSSTGRIYFMEISTNLPEHAWIMTGSNVPGIGGIMTLYETNTADALHYRIGVKLP